MTTRLELAKQKLERLEGELNAQTEKAFAHMRLTNGQPMNDKTGGRAFFNQQNKIEDKAISLTKEIEQQIERIEMLEQRQANKEKGLTANGGLQTSVQNIEALKARKQTAATRRKIEELEKIKEKSEQDSLIMSEATRALIDSGKVKKWEKKPIYYFVAGMRKVALVIDSSGDFKISKAYPAIKDEDKARILEMLEKGT